MATETEDTDSDSVKRDAERLRLELTPLLHKLLGLILAAVSDDSSLK